MNSHHGIPRILTVDDRSENLLVYGALLKSIQCEVVACNSGLKAVEYLAENEAALILLDVQMPIMDGFEVARRIREMPHHAVTPILFVTAADHDRQQILKAARLKVADIIYKPIDVEVFLAKIQIFLDLYESREFKKIKDQTTFIEAPGEVSKLYQESDWGKTALGTVNQWPLSLKTMVGVMLNSKFPAYIVWGPERILLYNDAYTPLLADKHPKALGSDIREVWPEILDVLEPLLNSVFSGKASYFEDFPLQLYRNGKMQEGYFHFSYSPIRDDDEEIRGLLCTAIETTALKQANERLSKIHSISSSLTKSLTIKDIAQVVVNEGVPAAGAKAGVLCLQNSDGLHLDVIHSSGYDDQILGLYQKIAIVEKFPLCEAIKSEMPLVIQPNENLEHKFPNLLLKTDWHTRKALVAFPIKIRGKTLGVLGLTYDFDQIVDQKTLNLIQTLTELTGQAIDRADVYEKEIAARLSAEVAKDEAERANMLKSAFLANMSHEIRTPLGAMIGFADLLKDPNISSNEHASYIEILLRNGEQLSVIINDILDLSKVEAGHLTLEYFEAHPDLIASEVVSLLKMKAKEKNLELTYITHESTPTTVTSDPTRIRQILLNLVGNAIKFTHSGGIYITSFGHVNEDGTTGITFEIKDTGIGIPNEQKDRVFEMFVQADGSMTRRFGGTGLGLALSRRLARAMGGDVKVKDSTLGEGSIFSVTIESRPELLQASRFNQPAISESNEAIKIDALQDVRVLVVDDAPDNQFLIRSFLSKRGAQVDSAENGLEGYKKALIGGYDIVLMDIQMPVMDGYTATQKLRDHGYKKPIIALTAHAMNEVAKKCLNVGCTDHLAKPIDSKQLIRTIARYSTPH